MAYLNVDELYEKIDALEEIEKIAKDSGLSNMISGFLNFSNITKLIKLVKTFKNFGINKNIWSIDDYKINRDVAIVKTDYISNVGKLDDKEELLAIKFPTGCYVFGDYYSNDFFNKFFAELQEVKPKYIDELNNNLYYDCSNSKEAYEHYEKTCKKYSEKYNDVIKKEKIKEFERKLSELKGE